MVKGDKMPYLWKFYIIALLMWGFWTACSLMPLLKPAQKEIDFNGIKYCVSGGKLIDFKIIANY